MPLLEVGPLDDRQLQDTADLLAKSHKVLVITGAGISTSCGIPDFRSKDGLYSLVQDQRDLPSFGASQSRAPTPTLKASEFELPSSSQASVSSATSSRSVASAKLKGQDLFDASVWKNPNSTAVFYRFIASLRKKIREEVRETSPTHKFIRTLRDGGRLMRCYTQNIDGLEAREGLSMDLNKGKGSKRRFVRSVYEAPRPSEEVQKNSDFDGGCEVVPLHGDLDQLRCSLCQTLCSWDLNDRMETLLAGEAPQCEECSAKDKHRRDSGKRGLAVGLLRPNIVLYQEEHPSNALLAPLPPFDISSKPEILLIMGTSLKVHGLQKLIREFSNAIHTRKGANGKVVFVNRTKPAESVWGEYIDEWIAMDCDDWVKDLRSRREDLWLRQGELPLLQVAKSAERPGKEKGSRVSKNLLTTPRDKPEGTQQRSSNEIMTSVTVINAQSVERPQTPASMKRLATAAQEPFLPTPPPSRAESVKRPVAPSDFTTLDQVATPVTASRKRKLAVYEDVNAAEPQSTTETPGISELALKRRSSASDNSFGAKRPRTKKPVKDVVE